MDVKTLIQGVLKASEKPEALFGYARTARELGEALPDEAQRFLERARETFKISYDLKETGLDCNGAFYALSGEIKTQTPEVLGPWFHLSVVAHELTHLSGCLGATQRPSQVYKQLGLPLPPIAGFLEECVAEVGALLILERLGWAVLPELHFAYVAQYFENSERTRELLEAYLPNILASAQTGVEWLWRELTLNKEETNGTDSLSQVA